MEEGADPQASRQPWLQQGQADQDMSTVQDWDLLGVEEPSEPREPRVGGQLVGPSGLGLEDGPRCPASILRMVGEELADEREGAYVSDAVLAGPSDGGRELLVTRLRCRLHRASPRSFHRRSEMSKPPSRGRG